MKDSMKMHPHKKNRNVASVSINGWPCGWHNLKKNWPMNYGNDHMELISRGKVINHGITMSHVIFFEGGLLGV